jgi:hypothetical protein
MRSTTDSERLIPAIERETPRTDRTMSMDMQEQVARIQRMQEETRKFAAGTRKSGRANALLGLQVAIAGMIAGAALVGVAVALIRFFRPRHPTSQGNAWSPRWPQRGLSDTCSSLVIAFVGRWTDGTTRDTRVVWQVVERSALKAAQARSKPHWARCPQAGGAMCYRFERLATVRHAAKTQQQGEGAIIEKNEPHVNPVLLFIPSHVTKTISKYLISLVSAEGLEPSTP